MDSEQQEANTRTLKDSKTIAALDLTGEPQHRPPVSGLIESEWTVSALDLAGVDDSRRAFKIGGGPGSIACIAVVASALSNRNHGVRTLLNSAEDVWRMVDDKRRDEPNAPLLPGPPPPLSRELRDAGWSMRQCVFESTWYYHHRAPNGDMHSQNKRPTLDGGAAEGVLVPTALMGALLGKDGSTIDRIQSLSGARIDAEPSREMSMWRVTVAGTPDQIQKAQFGIQLQLQPAAASLVEAARRISKSEIRFFDDDPDLVSTPRYTMEQLRGTDGERGRSRSRSRDRQRRPWRDRDDDDQAQPRPSPLPRELREAGWNIDQARDLARPGGTGRAGAFGDNAPKPPRKNTWCYVHTALGGKKTTQFERPGWPEEPPTAPLLHRMRPSSRDSLLALPADVVSHVLSYFPLDPWVRDALGHAPLDGEGRREWQNDEELATLLSFAVCSQTCRRAARSDVHWRERIALLERTYVLLSESADARVWRARSLDAYVDPRNYNLKYYEQQSPFVRYRLLAQFRRNVRAKILRMHRHIGDARSSASQSDAEDRALLQRLADSARAEVQARVDDGEHGTEWEGGATGLHDGYGGYGGDCNCTHDGANCVAQSSYDSAAAAIVDYVLKNLDAGVVGNARRLIVRGFAGYVVPNPWADQEE